MIDLYKIVMFYICAQYHILKVIYFLSNATLARFIQFLIPATIALNRINL